MQPEPLSPKVFLMLKEVYHGDRDTLHDVVSDVVDALLEYHAWALVYQAEDTRMAKHRAAAMSNLESSVSKLMATRNIPVHYIPTHMFIDYVVGLLANHFWKTK